MLEKILKLASVLAGFLFSLFFLNTIQQYFPFRKDAGFLKFKQEIVDNKLWITFFYIHIVCIIICLLAGLTQFSSYFLREYRNLHRIFGKVYVFLILFINFPACLILGIFSNGGTIGILGFITQDIIWLYFTWKALIFIKKGRLREHKNFMIYSYSITTTAITFRIIKNTFYTEDLFYYDLFYGITVWLSLSINLLVAYLIISRKSSFKSKIA